MSPKKQMAAHEATTDAELQAWHDEAYAKYEAALEAYAAGGRCSEGHSNPVEANFCSICGQELPSHNSKTRAAYDEARENLQTGVRYWRQVGEELGIRTGIGVVDNVIDPEGEGQ